MNEIETKRKELEYKINHYSEGSFKVTPFYIKMVKKLRKELKQSLGEKGK